MKVLDILVAILLLLGSAICTLIAVMAYPQQVLDRGLCAAGAVVLGIMSVFWMTRYTIRQELQGSRDR